MARSVVVLPQPEGPSRVRCSPAATENVTPADRGDRAVADDQVADLDGGGPAPRRERLAHVTRPAAGWRAGPPRRGAPGPPTTARVWSSAIAAVSSVLVENHDSTMVGVMTLALGPISRIDAPSSRTLAMKRSSQAAIRPGREQRHGDGAHAVAPRRPAHLGRLLERAVDLEHHPRDGPEPERQEHGEVGDQEQPEGAVDRDREDQPGPQHAEREDEARHRLREHQHVLDRAHPGQPRAVDHPREEAHQHHADARGAEAQEQAVPERGPHRVERERGLVVGEGEVACARERGGEPLERGVEQGDHRQDHRDREIGGAEARAAASAARPRPWRAGGRPCR